MRDLFVYGTTFLVATYVLFLGQIAIHNCVHGTLVRSRRWNRIIGTVIASIELANYEGWRAAHLLHHRYVNTPRDPYRIELSAGRYIVTQYFRHVREFWDARRYLAAVLPTVLVASAYVTIEAVRGRWLSGLAWMAFSWLLPTVGSHFLVAHFNYITHVGLPEDRQHNTRNFCGGIWDIVNKLTFNFYLHKEHHRDSGKAVPLPPRVVELETLTEVGHDLG